MTSHIPSKESPSIPREKQVIKIELLYLNGIVKPPKPPTLAEIPYGPDPVSIKTNGRTPTDFNDSWLPP